MARYKETKEKYTPVPYFRKTKEGKPIPRDKQAQMIAEFYNKHIWNLENNISNKNKYKLNDIIINNHEHMDWDVGLFKPHELDQVLKKLKRKKRQDQTEYQMKYGRKWTT